MAKKLFTNTNTTYIIILLIIVIGLILYIGYGQNQRHKAENITSDLYSHQQLVCPEVCPELRGISARNTPIEIQNAPDSGVELDPPFSPPLRNDGVYFPRDAADVRGTIIPVEGAVPINMTARGLSPKFTQVGVLYSKSDDAEPLPLMGRQIFRSGDKWQYYTTSNRGIYPVRMPLKVCRRGDKHKKSKSTMVEYGVDELYNGDEVTVDGFREKEYRVEIYENSTFRYM